MVAFLAVVVTLLCALLAAVVTLYSKRIDRRTEIEARHAAAREQAYDWLLAAGDAAWFYRTQRALDSDDKRRSESDTVGDAALDLFAAGFDRLKESSSDFDRRHSLLEAWYTVAFNDPNAGPRSFESVRDTVVNQRRIETGLIKTIQTTRELSFFERLRVGHTIQRLPGGIENVIRTTDGEFLVSGTGEEFIKIMIDMMNYRDELISSREQARSRLKEWRRRGIWSPVGCEAGEP
jgi:hypothetical protein